MEPDNLELAAASSKGLLENPRGENPWDNVGLNPPRFLPWCETSSMAGHVAS